MEIWQISKTEVVDILPLQDADCSTIYTAYQLIFNGDISECIVKFNFSIRIIILEQIVEK